MRAKGWTNIWAHIFLIKGTEGMDSPCGLGFNLICSKQRKGEL